MEILICHLTRMSAGKICVAGIDIATNMHVRPVFPMGNFTIQDLRANGGTMEIGAVVDIGDAVKSGYPPEVEDHDVKRKNLRYIKTLSANAFSTWMAENSSHSVRHIFGERMSYEFGYATLKPGEGKASLGCLSVQGEKLLHVNDQGRIRMRFMTDGVRLNLPITDLRCFENDAVTLDKVAINQLQQLVADNEIVLSLGVTRLYRPKPEAPEAHWLQVNGVFPVTNPYWK